LKDCQGAEWHSVMGIAAADWTLDVCE